MAFISEWVGNIIIFLLLAMVIDMLLPDTELKKYTKLATGLILMAIIITPIFKILSADFEEVLSSLTKNMDIQEFSIGNKIESKKNVIQAAQAEYTLEQMAVQMKTGVEKELIEKYQVEIQSINIKAPAENDLTMDDIQNITVELKAVDSATKGSAIEAIKPIEININEKQMDEETTDYEAIKSLLVDRWEVQEDMIEIVSGEASN
ncbi:stage III sporulation protein AF [Lederbergia graminis]|uniref:Stage III sporulation protein AF n=1 Tax=Lederbergia graminis TaxID=735518 RepID=A0ABW0LBV9_9BACI|nr:stage III sporulation protein AF [Paenibacillus bovis]HLU22213.1 stage III sporulation protein AF [Bacillaceae bacterium]